MEYLLKHSPIKIQEFLTESTYATPEPTSNAISPSALRRYVLRLRQVLTVALLYDLSPPIEHPLKFHGESFGATKFFLGKFFDGSFSGSEPEMRPIVHFHRTFGLW